MLTSAQKIHTIQKVLNSKKFFSFLKLEMVAKSSNDLALFDILWQVSKSNFTFSGKFWQKLKLAQ